MKTPLWILSALSASIVSAIALQACGGKLSTNCGIKQDQMGAFMPKYDGSFPVHVQIDQTFSLRQQTAIRRAVEVWNALSQEKLGYSFFTVESAQFSDSQKPGKTDCGFDGAANRVPVIRESSNARWGDLKLTNQNGAANIRCTENGDISKQVIMVNVNYTRDEQLLSIAVHELGHSLGLGHSCTDSDASSDYVSCAKLDYNHPYRAAVMFPRLMVDSSWPEVKESLRQNDTERALCLYEP